MRWISFTHSDLCCMSDQGSRKKSLSLLAPPATLSPYFYNQYRLACQAWAGDSSQTLKVARRHEWGIVTALQNSCSWQAQKVGPLDRARSRCWVLVFHLFVSATIFSDSWGLYSQDGWIAALLCFSLSPTYQGKYIKDEITAHDLRWLGEKWRKFGPWEAAIKCETLLITNTHKVLQVFRFIIHVFCRFLQVCLQKFLDRGI